MLRRYQRLRRSLEDVAGLRHSRNVEEVDCFLNVVLAEYVLRLSTAVAENVVQRFGHVTHNNVVAGIVCIGKHLALFHSLYFWARVSQF